MPKKTATAAPPPPPPPQTREEMEDLVHEICLLDLKADSLIHDLECELQSVRARYEDDITKTKAKVKAKLDLAEEWSLQNPEAFAGKKSVIMVHGAVGWRTGMPQLKTLKGWTFDRVINVLKVAFPEYVRRKETVAKDLIIDQRDTIGADGLKRIGVEIVQEDSFFVEKHKETPQ